MKTKHTKICGLMFLLLITACGKPPQDQEEIPAVVEKTISPETNERSARELKNSISDNDLDSLKRIVLENQIDLKETVIEGESPLITAIRSNATDVRDYLLNEKHADIEEPNSNDETPLMVAVAYNQINTVQILLKKKAQIDRKDIKGDTALLIAVKKRYEDVAILLIQSGANIRITDSNNLDAFDLAVDSELINLGETLRKMMQTAYGTPDVYSFRDAIVSGDVHNLANMLRKFPTLGSTYEIIDPLKLTISVKSANAGLQMAYLLLINKTNVNGPEKADYSPLIQAVLFQKVNFVELFLNHKANTQLLDKEGRSPLIHAVGLNNYELVEMFLARSALKKYKFKRAGSRRKTTMDSCDIARAVGKKLKDSEGKKTNKLIKKALDCGFWDWLL